MTHKRQPSNRKRIAGSKPRRGATKHKKRSGFFRLLRRLPSWLLWISGMVLVVLYAVVLYYIFVGPFSMRWRAQFGSVPEPQGYEVRGIDISHYQQKIDWAKLQDAEINGHPIRFVIIKATEGVNLKDINFKQNIRQARRRNMITGAYHFYIPGSNPKRQAECFIQNVKLERGDLPPILDVEKMGSLSNKELQEDVLTWLELVEKHYGVRPILYASYDFKRSHLNTPELNKYPLWVARYYKEDINYDGPWLMWQYTDIGEVEGIKGKVDCNVFNGSLHELKLNCIK